MRKLYIIIPLLLILGVGYLYLINQKIPPSIIESPSWAGNRNTFIMDHHTHSNVSDGSLSEADLVALAIRSQCNVLAITDHSDIKETVNWQQLRTMDALRNEFPELLLFTGLELNMPSYNGREHVTVLTLPEHENMVLPAIKIIGEQDNDRKEKKDPDRKVDQKILHRINQLVNDGADLLMIYNHPSRKDTSPAENYFDLMAWKKISPAFIGFEGAPGHQKTNPIGDYGNSIKTIDRWDPMVSEVGGAWDQMLGKLFQKMTLKQCLAKLKN